jgi:drug/metabolite transporter (DMT)-like permease
MKIKNQPYLIAVMLTLISALFIVLTTTMRIMLPSSVSTFESILYMNLVTLIIFSGMKLIKRQKVEIKQKKLVLIRSLLGLVGVYLFFLSYQLGLSLSSGTMIVQMQPIFSAVGMLIFMKEILRKDQKIILPITLFISLVGVSLITNIITSDGENAIAVIVSLSASLISGVSMVIIRKLMLQEDAISIGIVNSLISVVVPFVALILMQDIKLLDASSYLLLFLMGITNALVVLAIAGAAYLVSPTKTGPYFYAAVIFAPIIQYIAFGTVITGNVLIGSCIIVVMSFINFLYTNSFNQKEKKEDERKKVSHP